MKIVILGGGYTGLIAAKELVELGHDITVLEKNEHVGGMADTVKLGKANIEKHYRHIFISDKYVIELINELGLKAELIWPLTKMGYFIENNMYEFGNPISLLTFKPLNMLQKFIFGVNVLYIKMIKKYKKLEKISAQDWLIQHIGKDIYSKVWEPLLVSKFGDKRKEVSMSWLWGKIKLRSSSINGKGENLGYIRGSYQKLTDALENHLLKKGVKIIKKAKVLTVKRNETYDITYLKNEENNKIDNADIVISTLSYKISKDILYDFLEKDEKEKLENLEYTSARTMVLVLNKSFMPYYWLNIGDRKVPFGGIIEHTNFISKENYEGKTILYISNYMYSNSKLYHLSKEDLLKEYLPYLKKINKNFSEHDICECHLFSEEYAQPIITLNYSNKMLNKKLKQNGLYIVSSPQIYPEDRGLNYAIRAGKSMAELIE